MFGERAEKYQMLLSDFSAIRLPGQPSTSNSSSSSSRSRESPEAIMEMLRASPSELALLKQNNPVLGEAFEKGLAEFSKVRTFFAVDDSQLIWLSCEIISGNDEDFE